MFERVNDLGCALLSVGLLSVGLRWSGARVPVVMDVQEDLNGESEQCALVVRSDISLSTVGHLHITTMFQAHEFCHSAPEQTACAKSFAASFRRKPSS